MARALQSMDGVLLAVEQDDVNDRGVPQFAVYDTRTDPWTVLFDRFDWEANTHTTSSEPAPSRDSQPEDVRPSPSDAPPVPPSGGGGLVEHISSRAVRPRLSAADIRRFLPDRGPFMFPAPYGTRGVRVTNASDGSVRPIGMSYWPNLNNSTGRADLRVLVSCDDVLTVFSIDKASFAVQRIGTLPFRHTGESCYWSLSDPDLIYIPDGTRIFRFNVRSHQVEVAVDAPSEIRQCHTSYDGRTHSMTLGGGPAVFRDGRISPFNAQAYDECQIDKSGRWLLIKVGQDNVIIDLDTGREFIITDQAGAVGHSDMGWGYMVGEDDQTDPGGVFRLWLFTENGPVNGGPMYSTDWTGMTRYCSHCNAIRSRPENHAVLYSSSHNGDVPRGNELVLGRLDGSGQVTVVCPNLTDLSAGGGGEEYWRKTRANLDPTGRYACWSGNMGTDRMDVFVVELPAI